MKEVTMTVEEMEELGIPIVVESVHARLLERRSDASPHQRLLERKVKWNINRTKGASDSHTPFAFIKQRGAFQSRVDKEANKWSCTKIGAYQQKCTALKDIKGKDGKIKYKKGAQMTVKIDKAWKAGYNASYFGSGFPAESPSVPDGPWKKDFKKKGAEEPKAKPEPKSEPAPVPKPEPEPEKPKAEKPKAPKAEKPKAEKPKAPKKPQAFAGAKKPSAEEPKKGKKLNKKKAKKKLLKKLGKLKKKKAQNEDFDLLAWLTPAVLEIADESQKADLREALSQLSAPEELEEGLFKALAMKLIDIQRRLIGADETELLALFRKKGILQKVKDLLTGKSEAKVEIEIDIDDEDEEDEEDDHTDVAPVDAEDDDD